MKKVHLYVRTDGTDISVSQLSPYDLNLRVGMGGANITKETAKAIAEKLLEFANQRIS